MKSQYEFKLKLSFYDSDPPLEFSDTEVREAVEVALIGRRCLDDTDPLSMLRSVSATEVVPTGKRREEVGRRRAIWLRGQIAEQESWIERCGGDLAGYIRHYGSADEPDHYGNGGEAIYAADLAHLETLRAALR